MRVLLLLFFAILQIGVAKGATVAEQFNLLLTSEHVLGGNGTMSAQRDVIESRNGHDNFALVYVEGSSVLISSSVINSSLYKFLRDEDISSDQPAISVMDLLYFYKSTFDGSLIEGSLSEKLRLARINDDREILVQMLKLVVNNFVKYRTKAFGGIFYKVQNRYFNSGELEKIAFIQGVSPDEKVQPLARLINLVSGEITGDLDSKKRATIDFLQRLKLYVTEVSSISDEVIDENGGSGEENLLLYTSHRESDKQILLQEIEQQLNEIENQGISRETLAKSIVNLARLIRGPNLKIGDIWRDGQYEEHHTPNQYVSAITHTEQMVDWLSRYFGNNIFVKISGKAPCVKCSHYIKYAQGIIPNWNARTILGYTVGWSGRNPMLECMQYRYPVKVFSARRVNTDENPWALVLGVPRATLTRKLFGSPGTYDDSDFGTNLGVDKSNCYAIENVDEYTGQLTMRSDGSIVQTTADRGSDPMLVPFDEAPIHDEPSSAETEE